MIDSLDESFEQAVSVVLNHMCEQTLFVEFLFLSLMYMYNLDCVYFTSACGRGCLGRSQSWSFWTALLYTGN